MAEPKKTNRNGLWKFLGAVLAGAVLAGSSTWMISATDAARQQEIIAGLSKTVKENCDSIKGLTDSLHSTQTQGARIETKLELVMQELQRVREALARLRP